ncbi:hypothetical protein Hanom_Chr07g00648101 [Helianthus anomalus]
MLSGLRADGKEGKQVEALTQVIRLVLVGLLNHESNPDIMLLAARAPHFFVVFCCRCALRLCIMV